MSIRARILASVGILFLVALGMFAATWSITSEQRSDGLVINLAGRQRMQVQRIAKDVLALAHQAKGGGAPAGLADDIRKRLSALESTQGLLARGGTYENGKKFTIDPSSREAGALLDEAGRLIKPFGVEVEAILAKTDAVSPERLLAASEAVVAAQDKAVARLQAETEDDVATLMTIQSVGLGLSAVVCLAVLLMFRRAVIAPLGRLREYAGAVARGDLKAVPAGDYPPELAELRDALARMVASLERGLADVEAKSREAQGHAAEAGRALEAAKAQEARTAELLARLGDGAATARGISESVMDHAAGLLSRIEQVGQGAAQQRDRMMDTAAAMEEMNATVLEVARNASSAAVSAADAKDKAVTGADGVRSAVTSIEAIRRRILDLKESMTRLGQQADSIGHIMNVISDIADQTNLLALNAAIEAARAGDAGRGFAVVADEVRKLAEKTMTATKEVGDAVVSIQGQARENIAAVESAASGIEDSTRAAADSGRFMDAIVGIVDATATQVESIATASEEQSATSEEINRAVEEVNGIARDTAEDAAAASQALHALTELANDLDAAIRQMTGETGASRPALAAARPAAKAIAPSRPAASRALPPSRLAPAKAKALPPARPTPSRPASAPKPAAIPAPAPKPVTKPAAAKAPGNGSGGACSIGGALLQWDDSLATHISEVDRQHQVLVRMICDLHEAMRSGKGKHQLEAILEELQNYAVDHFGYEEKLMEQYKYPGYLNHRKEHEAFVDKVIAFGNDFRENRAALTTEVMNFLKNWLVGHIKGTDQKYAPFFIERGVN
ncbi:bacteriohemerythrin [Solidesulfovibrio carbinolicus]|uniref:Chemotaxis protein n=1 Tax=Solidesulfovibrio carbinolicus TaxID=296842 RepID=A0A4P6HLV4_9BACT|nr:bacteriohemerythrin [Solidesulfovibrio carbinolicus]QAZ68141.1 chemotaxis protein [Solidesulfovibrio carbinolicus]